MATEELTISNREELREFLLETSCDFTVIKFYAEWCKPCKKITPFIRGIIDTKKKKFEEQGLKNKLRFIEVNVDESFDLYAFLKKRKMINGIPSLFLYSKEIYINNDKDKIYIPQGCISGINEEQIRKVLDYIK